MGDTLIPDSEKILLEVLDGYANASKWLDAPFGKIKQLSNTHIGDVGQDFIARLCDEIGFECEFPLNRRGARARQNPWDMKINGKSFEVKTATEDVSDSFQFNHIRYHRPYDAVLCLGVAPDAVLFDAWSKAQIVTGDAGNLVTMDRGSSATWKLTKRRDALRTIEEFEIHIRALTDSL